MFHIRLSRIWTSGDYLWISLLTLFRSLLLWRAGACLYPEHIFRSVEGSSALKNRAWPAHQSMRGKQWRAKNTEGGKKPCVG